MRLALLFCLLTSLAFAAPIEGLVWPARVVRVVDGDTVMVEAQIAPRQILAVAVRVSGIDTPEIRGKCEAEKARAQLAKDFVERALGERVVLREIEEGKYAGRIVARIMTEDGRDLTPLLVAAGLARPYHGGRREDWC